MTKIVVPISDEERILLVKMANKNLRHPRDEARMILRSVLLGDQPTATGQTKSATPNLDGSGGI